MEPDAAPPPSATPGALSQHLHNKLQAAMVLRGYVKLVLDQGAVDVQPRTWYREGGTQYLEVRRRPTGERMKVRLDEIRDVRAY
jgi:hypothetical protein